jgi:hypothetical protein
MSVIAAYTDGTSTWIGSDTNSTCDYSSVDTGPKWFGGADGWWYGHVGTLRVADIIRRNMMVLTEKGMNELPRFFAFRMITLLETHRIKPVYSDGESTPKWCHGGILARAGEIWDIDPMLSMVLYPEHRLVARGAGADYALGAAYAVELVSPNAAPSFRVETAVLAAQEHHCGIRGLWLKQLRSGKPGLEEPVLEARAAE